MDTDRTARPASRNRHRRCVRPPVNVPGCRTDTMAGRIRRSAALAAGRGCGMGPTLTGDAARVADTCCPQRGRRTGLGPLAERPAAMTVEAAAEGPQRFHPGDGKGTVTGDLTAAGGTAWTPCPPTGRPKQWTVNPMTPHAGEARSAKLARLPGGRYYPPIMRQWSRRRTFYCLVSTADITELASCDYCS